MTGFFGRRGDVKEKDIMFQTDYGDESQPIPDDILREHNRQVAERARAQMAGSDDFDAMGVPRGMSIEQRRATWRDRCSWWRNHAENLKTFVREQGGVVAVEFALIAIPLTMLLGLVFMAGVGFYSLNGLQYGTQQAALASVAGNGADPQQIFASNIPPTVSSPTMTCTASSGSTTCKSSGAVANPFSGVFGSGPTFNLTATATAAAPAKSP